MNTEIINREPNQLATTQGGGIDVSFSQLVQAVSSKEMTAEAAKELFALYERMQAIDAERRFNNAMIQFRRVCPPIPRRTENTQFKVMRNGVSVSRKYASMQDISAMIRPHLDSCGLSYRWGDGTVAGGMMTVTCYAIHEGGHSESASVSRPVESKAGCSEQQKYEIAESYCQRRSLVKVLGLTDTDDDPEEMDIVAKDKLSPEQAAEMKQALSVSGADVPKFLKFAGADSIESITQDRFDSLMEAIRKRGQR